MQEIKNLDSVQGGGIIIDDIEGFQLAKSSLIAAKINSTNSS